MTPRQVNPQERDRVCSHMQLYLQALSLAEKEIDKAAVAQLPWTLAVMVFNGGFPSNVDFAIEGVTPRSSRHIASTVLTAESWRLQDRATDLSTLPDYEETDRDGPDEGRNAAPFSRG